MNEYFWWTLNIAVHENRNGLINLFRRYDKDHEGTLDAAEFTLAMEELGVGSIAHNVFLELDGNESGGVSYEELIKAFQYNTRGVVSKDCQRFLTALAVRSKKADGASRHGIDTSEWSFDGNDAETLRHNLSSLLMMNSMRINDLYRVLGRQGLSKKGFPEAMQQLGYTGDDGPLFEIFDEVDTNRSGNVAIDELYNCARVLTRGVVVRPRLV